MSYTIRTTSQFEREFKRLSKRYESLSEDLRQLLDQLRDDPKVGTEIGGGFRKIRLAVRSKGKGKRGGLRVVTYNSIIVELHNGTIWLMTIYDKSELSTISDNALKLLLKETK